MILQRYVLMLVVAFCVMTAAAHSLSAQIAASVDSVAVSTPETAVRPAKHAVNLSKMAFSPKQLIAPGVLMTSGVAIHCFAHESIDMKVRDQVLEWRAHLPVRPFDDYIQYLPLVADVGLSLLGVPSVHTPLEIVAISVGTFSCLLAISRTMKWAINSPRPNGADNNSFPSGHTCLSFAGAELVRMEYGLGWGIGAFAVATTAAYMRMFNNCHWFSDLFMGAGIGILCAHIGEWILAPVYSLITGISPGFRRNADIDSAPAVSISFAPTIDPMSGAMCASLAFRF